ncbi:hypothetical protein HID58_079797, partial [Brassica napus]
DIDEEEESCLEGSGTEVEVEDVKYRGIIVDGKKEKELQVASTSRQQGSVPRQLRRRVTGSKDMSRGGHGGSHRSSKKLPEEKPSYGCLVETRVQESNHQWCMNVAMPGWNSLTNYEYHPLGRIWVCWTDEVVVTRLHTSAQVITCAIQIPSTGEQYICSAIYAFNTAEERTRLWEELRGTKDAYGHLKLPWILIGYFNETLASREHSRSLEYRRDLTGMYHFQELVVDCSRIWDTTVPLFHSRAALTRFHNKLKLLKQPLRELNKTNYGDLPARTKNAYDVLCDCQNIALADPSHVNFARAAEAANRWNALARVEEKFYQQKSCVRWLAVGDQNTKVFHSMVQTRNAKNTIRRLVTTEGEVLTALPDIKKEAVSYFQSFLQGQDPNGE